jgi:hypothetical protein
MDTDALVTLEAEAMEGLGYDPYPLSNPRKNMNDEFEEESTVSYSWNMRCPKCGADDRIDIAATVFVRLTSDGTDADESKIGDHEWDNDSLAVCYACGFSVTVRDFEIKP